MANQGDGCVRRERGRQRLEIAGEGPAAAP